MPNWEFERDLRNLETHVAFLRLIGQRPRRMRGRVIIKLPRRFGVDPSSPLAVGAGQTGETLTIAGCSAPKAEDAE